MNLDTYNYKTHESILSFEFYSEGPKGRVKKIVRFSPQNSNGITYFSLGFGDWNEDLDQVDDRTITNNQDRDKILATVASTVLDFTRQFPDVIVYARGSTPARTRLYQISLAINWEEIDRILQVYGFKNGKWHSFEKNINYEAFLIKRKIL